ncbi:Uncharacterised protein [uncultured archaeon]|nr:Uncharacterised protein [uncultured archaeon]
MRFFTETTMMGKCFEDCVKFLFDPEYFSILHTSDNSDPDITIEYIPTQESFCIECKFKSQLYNNTLSWAKSDLIQNYKTFEYENDIPTFIVIGLGNKPCKPGRIFCIPLKDIKYTKLYLSFLEHYERQPPDKNFVWKNKNLI